VPTHPRARRRDLRAFSTTALTPRIRGSGPPTLQVGASYGDVVVISFLAAMDGGRSLNYPAKQKVYAQGDPADSVFYVQEGKLKVVVVLRKGRKRSSRWLNSSVRAV
jgi:hypothetical protein